ncbi:MAG: DNA-binding response regulator [Actinobacteria bacterium]|nr:DNA-binding response regulator [Actinomycetota bacterium]
MAAAHRKSPSRIAREHRVVVTARDRQLGIVIGDAVAVEGLDVRGPVTLDHCGTRVRDYVPRAIPVCLAIAESDVNVCIPIVEDVRHLPGLEIVVFGRFDRAEDIAELIHLGVADVMRPDMPSVELAARLQRCLASAAATAGATLDVAHLTVDLVRREVRHGTSLLNVTRTEFDLLTCLARRANRAVSAGDILDQVFGYPRDADSHVLTVHIQRLRAKVEPNPRQPTLIRSVRGVGYMLVTN